MKLLIDIPKEFEQHFQADRFEDSLHRLSADAHLIVGLYEQETAKMLRDAFKNAIPVPPHGRLIDADALRQSIKESIGECHKWADEVEGGEMYARVSQALGTFVECYLRVKAAPTIIPAEETLKEATNDQNNS